MSPQDSHASDSFLFASICGRIANDNIDLTVMTEWQIELADLVSFGKIWIEVLLTIPFGERSNLTSQPERCFYPEVIGVLVQNG